MDAYVDYISHRRVGTTEINEYDVHAVCMGILRPDSCWVVPNSELNDAVGVAGCDRREIKGGTSKLKRIYFGVFDMLRSSCF